MENSLSDEEKQQLLYLARQAIQEAVCGMPLSPLDLHSLSPILQAPGACFVTLTESNQLRGCIGALEPYQPLAEDVREHAVAAALQDFRFSPVQPEEVPHLRIEISRLTMPAPLFYECAEDLLGQLRPGVDGVVLRDGYRRATFLPQVWEKIPEPAFFLNNLCMKMGGQPDLWRRKKIQVLVYQVEEFHE